jgi:hypothetical protein
LLAADTKQRLLKPEQQTEDFLCTAFAVIYKVFKLVRLQQVFVVTSPINSNSNANPMSGSLTHDNIFIITNFILHGEREKKPCTTRVVVEKKTGIVPQIVVIG